MLGQAYLAGDKYAREKAVTGLQYILPEDKEARMRALAPLYDTMPKAEVDALDRRALQGLRPVTASERRRGAPLPASA